MHIKKKLHNHIQVIFKLQRDKQRSATRRENMSVGLEANRGDDIEIQPTDSMLIEMESSRSQQLNNYSFFIHKNLLRMSPAKFEQINQI